MSEAGADVERITLAPEVAALMAAPGAEGDLARAWLDYVKAMIGLDGIELDDVATQDVFCIDLEMFGIPRGIAAFRAFRDGVNMVLPDETFEVLEMTVLAQQGIVETRTRCTGTHGTQLLGIPASGRLISWEVKTLNHFIDGRMALRWDRVDVPALVSQLEGRH